MGWYDWFSVTYDAQLEALYRPWRAQLVPMLGLCDGDRVLDLACGTGQNFDLVVPAIGAHGRLVGVDLSSGMLGRARSRATRNGWDNVTLVQADATTLSAQDVGEPAGSTPFDVVLCTVGLEGIPDAPTAFARAWDLLRPGGRFGLMAVHAERRSVQTCLVEWIARADLSGQTWLPLEAVAVEVEHVLTAAPQATFGGQLHLVVGRKPTVA